jgi:hypothetical protein
MLDTYVNYIVLLLLMMFTLQITLIYRRIGEVTIKISNDLITIKPDYNQSLIIL